jgi:hypothetical protein
MLVIRLVTVVFNASWAFLLSETTVLNPSKSTLEALAPNQSSICFLVT